MIRKATYLFLTPVFLFVACAAIPEFQLDSVDRTLFPVSAVANFPVQKGTRILWGGMIISSKNTKQGSLLEVLAYPLNKNHKPDTQTSPLGRFLIEHTEYLETVDYAAGRTVSVVGPLVEIRKGFIGEAEYQYPVLNGEQLFLWPTENQTTEPEVHFGFGIMIHN